MIQWRKRPGWRHWRGIVGQRLTQTPNDQVGNAKFFTGLDEHVEKVIQEANIDHRAIESEYRRALPDSKKAYIDAQTWRPNEHSNQFKHTLGALLGAEALNKGKKRAEIFQAIFKASQARFGTVATLEHMTSARAEILYETAHKSAYPPGYPYQSLDPQQFRFLELLPNEDHSARPQCRLYRGKPDNVNYAALSYVWGQRDTSNPLFIELESQPFEVTPNLFAALQHLRHPSQKISLWVDAICINQNDVSERNEQVKMMTDIYESAEMVLMWLGLPESRSDLAMRFLVDYDNGIAENVPRIDLLEHSYEIQAGLTTLLSRKYWSRVWIMQEVILSKTAYICCGNYIATWESLNHLLLPLTPLENLQLQVDRQFHGFKIVQSAASDLVWPMAQLYLKKRLGGNVTCWEGLQMARQRGATDPRDFIFSLLGFVEEIPIEVDYGMLVADVYRSLVINFIRRDSNLDILTMCRNFDPDVKGGHRYDQLPSEANSALSSGLQLVLLNLDNFGNGRKNEEAYKEREIGGKGGQEREVENAENEIKSEGASRTFEDVSRQNPQEMSPPSPQEGSQTKIGDSEKNTSTSTTQAVPSHDSMPPTSNLVLPSWIPRWDINEIHPRVQIALDPRRTLSCSASGSVPARVQIQESGRKLLAQGILIDVIDCFYKQGPQDYLELIRAIPTVNQVFDVDVTWQRFRQEWATWESFIEQHPDISQYENVEGQREAFVDSALMGLDVGGEENKGAYHDLLAMRLDWPLIGAATPDISSWTSDAFVDSQKHTFVITKKGFMGRGPRTLKEGDVICILYCGRIPFALRPVGSDFYLLGECYISGAMKGELIREMQGQPPHEQDFSLI